MRITIISDTHNQHRRLQLPETTDMIIHAGDFSNVGKVKAVEDFLEWFGGLPYAHKILIGGNHDFLLEEKPVIFRHMLPTGVTYLEDSGAEIAGIRFWGSPITPYFSMEWAFNRHRGSDICRHWEQIPQETDVLITHGPPRGYGDRTVHGMLAGCFNLMERVADIKPKYHIFGHIHEGYGLYQNDNTTFINASVVDVRYALINEPVVIEL